MVRFKLQTPSELLRLLTVLGLVGLLVLGSSVIIKSKALLIVGLVLGAPLMVGAVVALTIGVPFALWTAWKESKNEQERD